MKTALQQFIEAIISGKITDTLLNQQYYLDLEKKQIMDAYNHGYRDGESAEESTKSVGDISEFYDADDYFNKTYNNNHFPEVGNKVIEKPN